MKTLFEMNDITVIYDIQQAYQEKEATDAKNRKNSLFHRIVGTFTWLLIFAGAILWGLQYIGMVDSSWCVLISCLTGFPVVLWFYAFCSAERIPYSSNLHFILITDKKRITKMWIEPARRYSPSYLCFQVKDTEGKEREDGIQLSYDTHICDDIKQDVLDLTMEHYGVHFEPASRKKRQLDKEITSMRDIQRTYEP